VRQGEIQKLTRDHSLVEDALLERPHLKESDLAYLPKNVITRALGIAPTVDVELRAVPAHPGDVFLLCSDGLHGLVSDEEIARIVGENAVLTEACGKLIDSANMNGGRDNITVVLIRIEDGTAPWVRPRAKGRKEERHAKRDVDDGAVRGRAPRVGMRGRGGSG
jgi:protein phosphatase